MNFKNAVFFFPALLLLIFFENKAESFGAKQARQISLTSDSIEGFWKTMGEEKNHFYDAFVYEYVPPPDIKHWLIKNDTIWVFRYPYQYYEKFSFQLRGDSIYLDGRDKPSGFIKIKDDSMEMGLLVRYPGKFRFKRENYSPAIIKQLIRDTFNFKNLIGKYQRIKHFKPDDEAAFDDIPPIAMPSEIFVGSISTAKRMMNKHEIYLPVKGVNQLFYVEQFRWDDYDWDEEGMSPDWEGRFFFRLTPAGWWKGESFSCVYVAESICCAESNETKKEKREN